MDTMNGSLEVARTANTAKVENSQGRNSRNVRAKGTAPKAKTANTANDQIATRQIAAQAIQALSDCGILVRQWKARDFETNHPTVMIAIVDTCLCGICGNYYPSDSYCGICESTNAAHAEA